MRENRVPAGSTQETVKIRGLARLAASIFAGWGALAAGKGVYDLLGGEPEANLYAPKAWAFVTRAQWNRFALFELLYGLSCLALAWYCRRWSQRLPETSRRPQRELEFDLFG